MPFEALKEQLLVGGIAPRWVRRYLNELEDHFVELTQTELAAGYPPEEAAQRARTLLGSDPELAAAWLAQPRFKSFTARAPWLVFGVLPPFMVVATFLVPVLTVIVIGKTHGMMTGHGIVAPVWYQDLVRLLAFASNLLLPSLIAAFLVWVAMRRRLPTLWPLMGTVFILLLGVQWHASFPSPGHRGGYISVGFWFLASRQAWQHWQLGLAQALLTSSPVI